MKSEKGLLAVSTRKEKFNWVSLALSVFVIISLMLIQPLQNVFAQSLLDTDFNSDSGGFTYQDDTFGTSQASYASGSRITGSNCYGGSGGCLNVRLGGVNSNTITNMSGGWQYTFNLATAQTGVTLDLGYRLVMPALYSYDEYSRVQVSLDGVLFGRGSKDYVDHTGGDSNFAHDTGWVEASLYLGDLGVGSHTLIIGGFSNHKNSSSEITDIYIDNVAMNSGNPALTPTDIQQLVGRLQISQFKQNVQDIASFGDRNRMSTSYAPYTSYLNALNWVSQKLTDMGYEPQVHTYSYSGWTGWNLYATKVGTVHPDQMYIVSTHLDGRGGGGAANDDGSGVALLLEMARVLAGADVETDVSVRFLFFDQEEIGLYGSNAYVANRRGLQGLESPAGSGNYPEPTWLGIIQHDMIMYDHGVGSVTTNQSPYADLDVEWRDGRTFTAQSKELAQTWRYFNGEYAEEYPANSANNSTNTDDTPFHNYVASISVRENRRGLSSEWINPYYHQTTDVYSSYLESDFRLGFNAVQSTLGTVAELAGASIVSTNQLPIANSQTVTTNEDTSKSITLTGSDPDSDPLAYSLVSSPAHGNLTGTAPNVVYTPAANYSGADSFSFRVNDGTADSAPATVSITVNAVNDAPVAFHQNLTTSQNTPLQIVLEGSDVDEDELTFAVTIMPTNGILSGTAPNLTYTPVTGFSGSDSFIFLTNDGSANSTPATITITVDPTVVNLPFVDDFETDLGWTVNPEGTDLSNSGYWERANPQGTDKQLDLTTSEENNLVTGHLAGNEDNKFDLDGKTTVRSPLIQLPQGTGITLSFKYYLAHGRNASSADYLQVKVLADSTWTVLDVRASNRNVNPEWKSFQVSLDAFSGQAIYIQIEAADLARNSLVEAAVDDVAIVVSTSSSSLLTATFDSGANGFTYRDDTFRGTSEPNYAQGAYVASGGVDGGGLRVLLGGIDTEVVQGISGGWQSSFNMSNPGNVVVSFWFKLTQSPDYDKGELTQILLSVDGILYGVGTNDFIAQIEGNGNGGSDETTGWQLFSVELGGMNAGAHTLVIGGYNNQKSYTNESSEILIDQVLVINP